MFLNSYLDNETLLKIVVSVNLEYSPVQNILVTYSVQDSLWNCSTVSQITTERMNNSLKPQRYPKIKSNTIYNNLLWITIIQTCCSSSMEKITA